MDTLQLFKPIESKFLELTDSITLQKECSFALQHISKSKLLQNCTVESKQKAVLNIAQIGLTLNPVAKEAYLVPRSVKQGDEWIMECCLEPSYVGLVKLLTDSGSVIAINTKVVNEGDYFDIDLANNEVVHKPYFLNKKPKGNIIGVYSIANLGNGVKQIEFMSKDETDEIKNRSESYKSYLNKKIKSCIWVDDEPEMMRKTVIRRIYKYLPRTEKMTKIDNAVDLDSQDYKPSPNKIGFIESLLQTAKLSPEEKTAIEQNINTINNKRADELIQYLQELQPSFQDGNFTNENLNKLMDEKTN